MKFYLWFNKQRVDKFHYTLVVYNNIIEFYAKTTIMIQMHIG